MTFFRNLVAVYLAVLAAMITAYLALWWIAMRQLP